jgi:DNA repair exonuclease SbcCD ATPase subunit
LADTLFTFDMKKYFILSMLISFAMICSCQKQDSTVEQQLAQRKTELDTREDVLIEREKALDERVNALDAKVNALNERVNALAENEQAAANAGMISPAQSSDTISDPTQATAERDRKIQEIAAEFRAMVPDSGKGMLTKERLSEAQGALKELMRKKQAKWQTSGATGSPALQAISPTPSPTP